jgi:hypothetical protein
MDIHRRERTFSSARCRMPNGRRWRRNGRRAETTSILTQLLARPWSANLEAHGGCLA